jgi:ribosome-associated translation inhibitor RaiA
MGRGSEAKLGNSFSKQKNEETIMILPLQTTFRNVDASPAVAARVQEEAEKLGRYFDHITSCRVIVEAPHRHHLNGESFHIRIELGVPGKELVVAHEPTLMHEQQSELHKHLEAEARTRTCMSRFVTLSERCGDNCRTTCTACAMK